jgi:hypothetical protein
MTMQNNPMMMMMMMNAMQGGGDGSPGGMDLGMLAGLFGGDENTVESIWEDAVTFGTARDRNGDATIGVLETRIVPPHADDPTPRVVIKTNGVILSRPADLKKISAAFARMADDPMMIEAFDYASSEEVVKAAEVEQQEKRNSAMIAPMLGMGS